MTPLIGITTYSSQARWRDWSAPAAVLPRTYVDAVRRGGGRPVLLPPGGTAEESALTLADLDGLVIAGGEDVDPVRYGAAPHPATGAPSAERDSWELALMGGALETGLPLLAVCRGIQLLNVIRGGTLHQHLPHIVGHDEHSGIADDFGRHMVRIGEAGAIGRILSPAGTSRNGTGTGGTGRAGFDWPAASGHWLEVPTHHHQAVDRLGEGLVATAWAADGTVEAVELADTAPAGGARFTIGVQWHPEEGQDPRLFRALVDAACRFSERRSILGPLRSRNRRSIPPGGTPPCRTARLLSPTRCSARSGPATPASRRSARRKRPSRSPTTHRTACPGRSGPGPSAGRCGWPGREQREQRQPVGQLALPGALLGAVRPPRPRRSPRPWPFCQRRRLIHHGVLLPGRRRHLRRVRDTAVGGSRDRHRGHRGALTRSGWCAGGW